MADISVRGQAEGRLAPTSATVLVTVRVGPLRTPDDAARQAVEACTAVDEVIDAERGSLVEAVVHLSVRTGKEWDHTPKGRTLLGWTATRTSEVECRPDGPGLTAMLGRLAGMKAVRLDGPRWQVAPGAEGMDDLRRAASADARDRAAAYADGLGLAVGVVQRIAEPGVRGVSITSEAGAPMATRAMRAGGAGDDDQAGFVTITAEPLKVEVAVEVTFTLLDPS